MLLAWLRTRPEAGTAGPKRLAVLPFENLGRPEDGYFADGVTDEVRGKLAALPGLEVIARTSSVQYKETTKSPQQIGRELGVDYLLTGTVRWEKDAGGPSRVRVSPELVQVSTASTKWQAPFEAPLTDVFRVQADVAARVAEALGVALGAGERERLAERPTENLAAYDAFLKGEEATGGLALDLAAYRRAIDYYERAVALDSNFRPRLGPTLAGALVDLLRPRLQLPAPKPLAGPPSARWRLRRSCPRATTPSRTTTTRCTRISRAPMSSPDGRGSSRRRTPGSWPWWPQNELALGHTEEGLKHLQRGAGTRSPLGRDRDNRGRGRWSGYAATLRRCRPPSGGSRSPRPTSG